MAAQVLSGSGNVSYTNSTGQNVRLVINYLETKSSDTISSTLSFPGGSIELRGWAVYGKTIAYVNSGGPNQNGWAEHAGTSGQSTVARQANPIPLEIALANGDTFSITGTAGDVTGYNIIIIPEAG